MAKKIKKTIKKTPPPSHLPSSLPEAEKPPQKPKEKNHLLFYCSSCMNAFTEDVAQCSYQQCGIERPTSGWTPVKQPGEIISGNYQIIKYVALGSSGAVYKAQKLDESQKRIGPILALKVLDPTKAKGPLLQRLTLEADIMKQLQHPNIISFYDYDHQAAGDTYLLTQFAEGGDLQDYLKEHKRLSPHETAHIGRQIAAALHEAHKKGVVHRDIKSKNIFLKRTPRANEPIDILLGDFGIAKTRSMMAPNLTVIGTFIGTHTYAAPEQFLGIPVSSASDIFSLAILLLQCMTGKFLIEPQVALALPHLSVDQLEQEFSSALPVTLPEDVGSALERQLFEQIFEKTLCFLPEKRCTLTELQDLLDCVYHHREPVAYTTDLPLEELPEEVEEDEEGTSEPSTNQEHDETASPEAPTNPPQPTPPAPQKTGNPLRKLIMIGGLAGFVALAATGVYVYTKNPWTLLSAKSKSKTERLEYKSISSQLKKKSRTIAKKCKIKKKSKTQFELKINPTGSIEEVVYKWASDGLKYQCITQQLKRLKLKRKAKNKIRMIHTYEW